MPSFSARLRQWLRHDSELWRRGLGAGVRYGPEPWLRYSPPAFGLAFCLGLPRQRAAVLSGLRRIHGERPALEEWRDVAAVFCNFASCMTDAMLAGAERGYVPRSHPIGREHLNAAVARGRGVIVATAHTAGWDVGGALLTANQSREVVVAMQHEADVAAGRLHDRARRRAGVTVIHVGSSGDPLSSLPLLHHLVRKQGLVALKFDRVVAGMRTRSVQLLGEPARIARGPLDLAALSGAPIVPVFTRRLGFLEYQPLIMEPIEVPKKPSEEQLDAAAQQLAAAFERFVRSHPTHWFRFSADGSV